MPILKCPKCHHQRTPEETATPERCPACGLYFEKWAQRDLIQKKLHEKRQEENSTTGLWPALQERFQSSATEMNSNTLRTRAIILLALCVWSVRLMLMDFRDGEMNASFMHGILLIFHEAGHIIFIPFGHFMIMLGGSLFQVLLPLILSAALLWQNRDGFGAMVGVWWCGTSLLDLSAYIYDAKNPQLIMLGGHTGADGPHDWIYLLDTIHKLQAAQTYGNVVHKLGILLMAFALWHAGKILWQAWRKPEPAIK
jgi:hypothetical protein